jgi:hypothetical protein
VLGLLLAACASRSTQTAPTVWVPPRVDLQLYRTIGLVDFASNQRGSLSRLASEEFLVALQSSQPGVRIIELGPEAELLRSIRRHSLDFVAVREIGAKFGVEALVSGRLDLSEARPKLNLSNPLASLNLRADVEASLVARVQETDTGATAWTGSARGTAPLAHARINELGRGVVSAGDPQAIYGELLDGLVHEITGDFRGYYTRQ